MEHGHFQTRAFPIEHGINSIAPLVYPEGKYVIPKPAAPEEIPKNAASFRRPRLGG